MGSTRLSTYFLRLRLTVSDEMRDDMRISSSKVALLTLALLSLPQIAAASEDLPLDLQLECDRELQKVREPAPDWGTARAKLNVCEAMGWVAPEQPPRRTRPRFSPDTHVFYGRDLIPTEPPSSDGIPSIPPLPEL